MACSNDTWSEARMRWLLGVGAGASGGVTRPRPTARSHAGDRRGRPGTTSGSACLCQGSWSRSPYLRKFSSSRCVCVENRMIRPRLTSPEKSEVACPSCDSSEGCGRVCIGREAGNRKGSSPPRRRAGERSASVLPPPAAPRATSLAPASSRRAIHWCASADDELDSRRSAPAPGPRSVPNVPSRYREKTWNDAGGLLLRPSRAPTPLTPTWREVSLRPSSYTSTLDSGIARRGTSRLPSPL
mmetsp:Transcript_37865/g.121829  ORF Transcript_37865/g.121829 Transcript_37865/m.121829 type:complete len:242 (-) Transcript_37865:638-1363(-)